MFKSLNRGISAPIAIIIIVVCALLVGGLVVWQYLETPEEEEKITEIKPLGEEEEEEETADRETDFDLSQIKEYLISINADELVSMEWNFVKKEKTKVLIVDFTGDVKQVSFLELPSKYCFVATEDGSIIYGGDIETFMSYQRPSGDYIDKYKTGEYAFCLKPYTLSSIPPEYRYNFDHQEINVNIPKNCSTNINDIDKECVYDLATNSLIHFANERFDVILYKNLSWVTEELKKETATIKEEFEKMLSSYSVEEIFIVEYKNKEGSLLLAATLDNKIIGLLVFNPFVY